MKDQKNSSHTQHTQHQENPLAPSEIRFALTHAKVFRPTRTHHQYMRRQRRGNTAVSTQIKAPGGVSMRTAGDHDM